MSYVAISAVSHALKISRAWYTGHYHQFFKLYPQTPNHGKHLVDLFIMRERKAALRTIAKAWVPSRLYLLYSVLFFGGREGGMIAYGRSSLCVVCVCQKKSRGCAVLRNGRGRLWSRFQGSRYHTTMNNFPKFSDHSQEASYRVTSCGCLPVCYGPASFFSFPPSFSLSCVCQLL